MKNKPTLERIKTFVEILAFFVAAAWAGWVFVFDKVLEPSKYPSFLTMNSEIEKVGENKSFMLFRIKVSILNKSKVREFVPASWFFLDGYRIDIDTASNKNDESYNKFLDSSWVKYNRFPRYFGDANYTLVHTGKILDESGWLNPDQEITEQFISLIPKNRFELLRLSLHAISAKKDDSIDRVEWDEDKYCYSYPKVFIKNDTVLMKDFDKKARSGRKDYVDKNYVKEYDLSYTYNVNEYALGFMKN